jgi:hypothetical protein
LKLFIALLFAVNALLLAMNSGWINLWESRDPERLKRQVDAERIAVLSPSTVPAPSPATNGAPSGSGEVMQALPALGESGKPALASIPGNGPVSTPSSGSDSVAGASIKPASTTEANAAAAAAANAAQICLEFPAMESDRAQTIETSMKQTGINVEIKSAESNPSYIVHLAPSESLKEAQRKLVELKRLGVSDAFLMQEGPLKLGISLGLFRAEEGAKAMVQQLAAKGIKSAKISAGNALKAGKVIIKASGTEVQLARVRQAASEVNLSLKLCGA